jgi:anti-anti-sigma factor
MSFDITNKENFALVKVNANRLDVNIAPALKSELVVISNKGQKNIILDVSNCSYCDSSGLRTVLVGNRICEDSIGTFILCGLQPDVESLIKISMLDTVLIITDTVEKAEYLMEKKESM